MRTTAECTEMYYREIIRSIKETGAYFALTDDDNEDEHEHDAYKYERSCLCIGSDMEISRHVGLRTRIWFEKRQSYKTRLLVHLYVNIETLQNSYLA